MASSICDTLLEKQWNDYDPSLAPEDEGIYCIGEAGNVIYVGTSKDIRRRLKEHKSGSQQAIGKHVKEMFDQKKQGRLGIKWVLDPDGKCKEGDYLSCIKEKLGYWPKYNMQKGNTCECD